MRLIWVDLETTGLDPISNEVLEVAVAEADLLNPFNIKFIYQAVMKFQTPIERLDPFILNMHTKNGLLEECFGPNAKVLSEVDQELSQLIEWVENKDERATLAGSSIHFDHDFIKTHMPLVNKKLSHRHYDVSAIKLFCQSMRMPKFKKAEAHRAKNDIIESVAHAQECAEWLKQNL